MYESKKMRVERLTFSKKGVKKPHQVDVLDFPVPQTVAILPITDFGNVILERHFRYAPREEVLEIPAGWMEKGERSVDAAKRELEEETGFLSTKIIELGSMYPSTGYSTEELFLFLAHVKESAKGKQQLEKGEEISLVSYSRDRVLNMIKTGKIRDPMTICAAFRASLRGLY